MKRFHGLALVALVVAAPAFGQVAAPTVDALVPAAGTVLDVARAW
jgi:hypothetical protein